MADTVASQTLNDGPRNVVMKFTNQSDATGESAVTKVDVSTLSETPSDVRIDKIYFSTHGMGVDVLWDATADVLAWHIPADQEGCLDFTRLGGLINNAGSGKTGDIKFTTTDAAAGDRYAITLHMKKRG